MTVTKSELPLIVPVEGNPNKFYWTGYPRVEGDGTGGQVLLIVDFSSQDLFGGHWLWDIQAMTPWNNDGANAYFVEINIATGFPFRGSAALGVGLTLKYNLKTSVGNSGHIIPGVDYPWVPVPSCRYKPQGKSASLTAIFDVNTNGIQYEFPCFGYIYNELMEAQLGSLR